ncbi:hypothetical protein DFS33DRAFT_1271187 [Desarmillaria ectypa]|nr:hypothetical protein DFS33DRAFT_1271187 [Desarmillaria ectypa]
MPCYPNIGACVQTAKLTAAASGMAPFPFIKGIAQCVVVVLEMIDRAAKNKSDLQDLTESIVNTLVAVRDTVIEHGPTSALHFQNICLEFQMYMSDLLSQLNSERRSCARIRRFLKARKIADETSTYQQRIEAAKRDFLICAATSTRLGLSDIQDKVNTGIIALTCAVEESQKNITDTVNNQSDIMHEEIHSWGVSQSQKVREILWGNINLKEYIKIPNIHSFHDPDSMNMMPVLKTTAISRLFMSIDFGLVRKNG